MEKSNVEKITKVFKFFKINKMTIIRKYMKIEGIVKGYYTFGENGKKYFYDMNDKKSRTEAKLKAEKHAIIKGGCQENCSCSSESF